MKKSEDVLINRRHRNPWHGVCIKEYDFILLNACSCYNFLRR
ncbi:hypothetical protein MERCI_44 [Klebsiella phage vB_KaeM_Merci]|nr:hypothetical protein MERCI_44 [Klebsiella phage vB_KaeM_Merci]